MTARSAESARTRIPSRRRTHALPPSDPVDLEADVERLRAGLSHRGRPARARSASGSDPPLARRRVGPLAIELRGLVEAPEPPQTIAPKHDDDRLPIGPRAGASREARARPRTCPCERALARARSAGRSGRCAFPGDAGRDRPGAARGLRERRGGDGQPDRQQGGSGGERGAERGPGDHSPPSIKRPEVGDRQAAEIDRDRVLRLPRRIPRRSCSRSERPRRNRRRRDGILGVDARAGASAAPRSPGGAAIAARSAGGSGSSPGAGSPSRRRCDRAAP